MEHINVFKDNNYNCKNSCTARIIVSFIYNLRCTVSIFRNKEKANNQIILDNSREGQSVCFPFLVQDNALQANILRKLQ